MKLSLTAWSFPSCTLVEAAAISRSLGIGAPDVGLFYRPALDKQEILTDPHAAAERLGYWGSRSLTIITRSETDWPTEILPCPG